MNKENNKSLKAEMIIIIILVILSLGLFLCFIFGKVVDDKVFRSPDDIKIEGADEFEVEDDEDEYTTIEESNSDGEEDIITCEYLPDYIEKLALKYFVKSNGSSYASNGEPYKAASILEAEDISVRINHLQNDHVSYDADYIINCNTLIGKEIGSDKTIDFNDYNK